MTRYRTRQYGTADWAEISISCDDEALETEVAHAILSPVLALPLHTQLWNDDTLEWEDVE